MIARRARRVLVLLALASACAPVVRAPAPSTSPSEPTAEVPMELDRACVVTGPEKCFDATDDNCNGILDEGCGIDTGPIQFAIAWAPPEVDVDLLVTDPNGELAEVGRTLTSGLTKQRDCPGHDDDCHGQNLENVYLSTTDPTPGRYQVRIVLSDLAGRPPPIVVRFGARVGRRSYALRLELDRPEADYRATFRL